MRKVKNIISKGIKGGLISLLVLLLIKENSLEISDEEILDTSHNNYIEEENTLTISDPLDEIIYSLEERGYVLTNEAFEAISHNYEITSSKEYTKYLDISDQKIIEIYQNIANIDLDVTHIYDYYNEETKEIEYSKLIPVIYSNSLNLANTYPDIFCKEDISYVLDLVQNKLTKEFNLDKKEMACILARTSFVYDDTLDNDIAATCTCDYVSPYYNNYLITFAGNSDTLRNSLKSRDYLLHELYHLFKSSCVCHNNNLNNSYIINGLGVGQIDFINPDDTTIIDYDFIEEAEAENSLAQYNIEPESYRLNNYILDNIKLALLLNKDFQMDTIMQQDINHNPLAFLQNFLVNPEDLQNSFINNVLFLQGYDYLLSEYKDYAKLPKEITDQINNYLTDLISYSQTELMRQFFNSLVIYTDNHEYNEDLNNYLISLFYHRLIGGQEILRLENNIPLSDSYNTIVNTNFEKMVANYLVYLQNKNINNQSLTTYLFTNDYLDFTILDYQTTIAEDKKAFLNKITSELIIDDDALVLKK